MKVLVIGAGIVGLCSARFLLESGVRDVTVVDRASGAGMGTSYANGALMHPSSVEPWNSPGILSYLLRHLGREDASVLLRLHALPGLITWGVRFIRESAPERFRENALANTRLAMHSRGCMDRIRRDDASFDRSAGGSIMVFRDRPSMQAAIEWGEVLLGAGVTQKVLEVDALIALEPALQPIAQRLRGGIHALDDVTGDCHRFCVDLVAQLQAAGVTLRFGETVTELASSSSKVQGVRLANGEVLTADAVVLSAGWQSVKLAASLGLRLPVRPAKGYSLTYDLADEAGEERSGTRRSMMNAPRLPVVDRSLHVAITPLGNGGSRRLRVAGTAEFCGDDLRIQPQRAANLGGLAAQVYPELVQTAASSPTAWAGLRPMSVDGKPLIGPTRMKGLYLNTGHGHLGWTVGAASGELVSCHITGKPCIVDATDFAPARFSL